MKQGGFHRTAAMLATPKPRHPLRDSHGFGLGVNTMAEIMLAATSANVIEVECVGRSRRDDITTEKLDLGRASSPSRQVLGVALDEAKLARYRSGRRGTSMARRFQHAFAPLSGCSPPRRRSLKVSGAADKTARSVSAADRRHRGAPSRRETFCGPRPAVHGENKGGAGGTSQPRCSPNRPATATR